MIKEPLSKTHLLRKKMLTVVIVAIGGSLFYFLLVRLGLMVPVGQIYQVLCVQDCQPKGQLHTPLAGNELLNYDQPLEQLVTTANNNNKISLLIEKSKHRLTLYYDQKPLKSYPVVFGGNPVGDKQAEGDSKTPEGILQIKDLYPHPQWSKFLWLDYPNIQSWRKYFQAKANGQLAWHISIGGEVGIHGVPVGRDDMISDRYNWTLGCPSLKNKDVDELYQWVQKGTIVEILP